GIRPNRSNWGTLVATLSFNVSRSGETRKKFGIPRERDQRSVRRDARKDCRVSAQRVGKEDATMNPVFLVFSNRGAFYDGVLYQKGVSGVDRERRCQNRQAQKCERSDYRRSPGEWNGVAKI